MENAWTTENFQSSKYVLVFYNYTTDDQKVRLMFELNYSIIRIYITLHNILDDLQWNLISENGY